MGLKLRIDWLDIHRETAIGKLLSNESDLAFGAAIDENAVEDDDELADKVIYSRPYYGTGYFLVTRQKGPQIKALAEVKGEKSRRLATEAGSVADYRLRQRGYLRSLYRNQLAVLKALDDGTVDYAYLWGNVGWTLHATPEFKLQLVPGYVPEDHWNIAVAMRKHDAELKRRVDEAIGKLVKDGLPARLLARYHVAYLAPFEEKKTLPEGEVIRHPVANRGIEPQVQKVQTSRNPYGGLERVRSAGALVVGLDQNNLPFSAAHPKPAGLDYEIAGLLAEKLGVSLRVYWAYSAHDSYPSKLATKKLCDVMLGVMPDDRFGERVLFSRPYYVASYQLVVPSENKNLQRLDQLGEEPLAVEPGALARGLEGRKTQTLASLEEILAAVAGNKAKAGYVISTRGHWMAERRWPGKLRFLDGDAADRFPICAAVRKSDRDLKAAIDQALRELAESGKLAPVFARWQVPYSTPPRPEKGKPQKQPEGAVSCLVREEEEQPAEQQQALAEGQAMFRGLCSGCHGGAGRGGKGPDLTRGKFIHGNKDEDLARVIREGVPKSTMKKFGEGLKEDQIARLVLFIRSLGKTPGEPTWKPYLKGDAVAGRKLFFDEKSKLQCAKCHSVNREGGRIGPALDRIASRRAPEFIMESLLEPSKEIEPEYETVQVVTLKGATITGLRVNESNFNIQLREENGRFHSFLKSELESVTVLKKSIMPDNVAELVTVKELHDLFAFLMSLE